MNYPRGLRLPDHYVPDKLVVVRVSGTLREASTKIGLALLETLGDPKEVRNAVDVLHYAGVIRSVRGDDPGELYYEWIRPPLPWKRETLGGR